MAGHEVEKISVRGAFPIDEELLTDKLRCSDVVVALHAGHCHRALEVWRSLGKPIPLIFIVSGTDLFQPILEENVVSDEFRSACSDAESIVTLARGLHRYYPEEERDLWRDRTQTILQGANPIAWQLSEASTQLAVVIGNLRSIKDPWLPVEALSVLKQRGTASGLAPLEVQHYGSLLDEADQQRVESAQARLPGPDLRWCWKSEVSRGQIENLMSLAPLLIHPSVHEGGANVVGEFLVSGLPILASRAPGNLGLLGEDWPGLFDVGDAHGLADLLHRWRTSGDFRNSLFSASKRLSSKHDLSCERESWYRLLKQFGC